MTTVDVYIRSADGVDTLSLHNGLFGPATSVYHDIIDAQRNGTAVGGWSNGGLMVDVTGRDLRPMLAKIDELTGPYHDPADNDRLRSFRQRIRDTAVYGVRAVEF